MSTATIPFSCRAGFIPFKRDTARPLKSYVTLNSSGGDAGLYEAMRLYWMLESISFSPAGTVSSTVGSATRSFSETHSFPIATGSPDVYACTGAISFGSGGTKAEPAFRTGNPTSEQQYIMWNSRCRYEYGTIDKELSEFVYLDVAYVSGEWRLYYSFSFELWVEDIPEPRILLGKIDNDPTDPYIDSGSVSVLGYSLPWYARLSDSLLVGTGSFSGAGLTATSEFWSF